MSAEFAVPIKNIIKTWGRGSKLAKKFGKSASTVSAEEAAEISESVENLQKSLEKDSEAVAEVYKQCLKFYAESFAAILVDDKPIHSLLKELRADLMDQIQEIQDVADEPEDFEVDIFTSVQIESQNISEKCIKVLKDARDTLTKSNLQGAAAAEKDVQAALPNDNIQGAVEVPDILPADNLQGVIEERDTPARDNLHAVVVERDDRLGLSSMRARGNSNSTEASMSTTAPSLRIITPSVETDSGPPPKPLGSWNIESPFSPHDPDTVEASSPRPRYIVEEKIIADPASSTRSKSRPVVEEQPVSTDPADFITEKLVESRVQANDDFLERRKFSRIAFHNEFRKSICSVDENRESVYSDIVSPISPTITSPIDGRPSDSRRLSSNDYPSLINSQRGYFLPSDRKRTSTASSQYTASTTPGDRQSTSSHSNHTTEDEAIVFRNSSTAGSTRSSTALAATLKIPGFGQGVEDGLIAVEDPATTPDYDNEKETVPFNHPHNHSTTPTASMKSVDSPMRHDSSFYKFGGFCDGALISLRGELSHKIVRRPNGTYGSIDFAKCLNCSYEVPVSQVEKDLKLDTSGIYGNSGIRWRQQFLTKSHVKCSSNDDTLYACHFCIQDRKTTDEHDATIFFSHKQLFQHLSRHPRPLTDVTGINALYGQIDPRIMTFDLHFIKNEAASSPYNMVEIAPLAQARPSANAITTYHPKNSRSNSKDPDGNPTLHFADGARLLGIAFPERFGGTWCTGFHDGEKGSFPAAAIILDLPSKEDILMSAQSSLIAFAKWDFKPRDAKEGGWLKFSRGDKITHIGYTFQDQWCWSGQAKGKWGLFPMAFVDGLQDGGGLMANNSSSGSVRSKSGLMGFRKFGSRSGGSPIIGKSMRSASVKSGSSGNGTSSGRQPGLEVVVNGVIM